MNFKKQISIFLALFILIVNSSASLVLHFCHNEISYISLVYQENSLIDSTEEDSCCSPQITEEDQKKIQGVVQIKKLKLKRKLIILFLIISILNFKL